MANDKCPNDEAVEYRLKITGANEDCQAKLVRDCLLSLQEEAKAAEILSEMVDIRHDALVQASAALMRVTGKLTAMEERLDDDKLATEIMIRGCPQKDDLRHDQWCQFCNVCEDTLELYRKALRGEEVKGD